MSNAEIAQQLNGLIESYANRVLALSKELEFRSQGSPYLQTPASRERRRQLRDALTLMPGSLAEDAAAFIEPHPEHAHHVRDLVRVGKDQNIESVLLEVDRISRAIAAHAPADEPLEALVTLDQAAAIAHLSKRTLARYVKDGKLPIPDFPGGRGKAGKWKWNVLRPALQKVCDRILPERFPSSRII